MSVISKFLGFAGQALVLLAVVLLAVTLVDRFTGNGQAWSFYAPEIDMTCVVGKDQGQKAMYCLQGDHRVRKDGANG